MIAVSLFDPGTLIGLGSFVVVFVVAPLMAITLAKQTRYRPLYESASDRAAELEKDATFWRAKAEEKEAAIKRLDGRVKEIEGLADNRPILE